MDIWVETAAGNLIKAAAVTRISIRPETTEEGSPWELCISDGAALVPFARAIDTRAEAARLRTRLAIALNTQRESAPLPGLVYFDRVEGISFELLTDS